MGHYIADREQIRDLKLKSEVYYTHPSNYIVKVVSLENTKFYYWQSWNSIADKYTRDLEYWCKLIFSNRPEIDQILIVPWIKKTINTEIKMWTIYFDKMLD